MTASSCTKKKEMNSFPEKSILIGLASPIELGTKASTINFEDYFPDASTIDSVVAEQNFFMQLSDDRTQLQISILDDTFPVLSLLKVYTKEYEYSILMKKSKKIIHKIEFSDGKEYKEVKIKGEFNAWNPANTIMQNVDGKWVAEIEIEPGKYSYLMVLDGVEQLDPLNTEKISNNMGGFNSVMKIGEEREPVLPYLFTESYSENSISIGCENNFDSVIVLYDNYDISRNNLIINGSKIEVTIPENAKTKERSFIRVWAYNADGFSNDLLIPLNNGLVLNDPSQIKRTDFEAAILYNVFVDRFFDGNPENTKPINDPMIHPRANYQGGDIEGIIKKIQDGYFNELGINTIWVSPLVKNPETAYGMYPTPKTTFSAYHGYWPILFTEINPHFGTEQDLTNLVTLVHEQNMNILLDFVAHHVHQDHPMYKEHPEWATDLYLPDGSLNTERWDEYRLTTWFDTFLPTFDLENFEVTDMLSDSAVYWIEKYDLDGFRHDATKHIPEIFWRTLTKKLKTEIEIPENKNLYQIGETYGTPELIKSYVNTGQLNAQFDFNVYDVISTSLGTSRSMNDVANIIATSLEYYGNHHLMGNITGNQDRGRFISYASGALNFGEDAKLAGWTRDIRVLDSVGYEKCAMLNAIISTLPGIPVIYYGDEIGMPGGNDPDNRRMMRFDNLNPREEQLKEITSKLLHFRSTSLPLIYGDYKLIEATDETLVYQRTYFEQIVIIAINKSLENKVISFVLDDRFITNEIKSLFENEFIQKDNKIEIVLKSNSFEILY
jgi:glycosidase